MTTKNKNEKDWTIMIYMAGDNNLSIDMAYALEQIKSVTTQTDKINLFVYYDGYSNNVPTLYCDFTEPNAVNYYRSYKIEDKLIKRLENEGFNENSASVNNIINFVDWCVNKVEYKANGVTVFGRKATNYAMIFSGHSLGFQSLGLFKDEKANYHMTLRRLRWMFERITFPQEKLLELAQSQQEERDERWDNDKLKERTTEIIGKPLELLGFDSCVMSMLEIGCQFRKVAKTMVASEGSIPNAGWSYAQILLGKITSGKKLSPKEIAASIVETFVRQQNKFSLADISVDMAAWDLEALQPLEKVFTGFVENLLACFSDTNSTVYKQMKRVLLHVHWQCQSYMMGQNIDLGDFCQLLIKEIDSLTTELDIKTIEPIITVGESCRRVLEKLRECVILTGFSGGNYQFSNGISLFFPWSWTSYKVSRYDYENLSFVKNNNAGKKWNEFLIKYLSEISYRKAKPLSLIDKKTSKFEAADDSIIYSSYIYADSLYENEIKIPENGSNKIPENGSNKIPENGSNKIPENGSNKIPENGSNKIPENGSNKIPENGSNKLFNALSLFFSQFTEMRNVESFWNHSGFTSNQVEFVTDVFDLESESQPFIKNRDLLSAKEDSKIVIRIGSETVLLRNEDDRVDI